MIRRIRNGLLIGVAVFLLSACSRTVTWEEEVPLNTGELIWVKRSDHFERRSEPGNPLKMGWWLSKRVFDFDWRGQWIRFETPTSHTIMVQVSDAQDGIAVVAWTMECAKRGYGEFRWINGAWQLQPNVNPKHIGQARNLMDYYSPEDGAIPARVTQDFIRNSRFDLPQKGGSESHLLASRVAIDCSGG